MTQPSSQPPFITRVRIQNYRSIESCDVALGPLQFLLGPNASGKSNFVDALRFTAQALQHTVGFALDLRGGLDEVRRKARTRPYSRFEIALDARWPNGNYAEYGFKIGAAQEEEPSEFRVLKEWCHIFAPNDGGASTGFLVNAGDVVEVDFMEVPLPPASADRLYLTLAAGFKAFRPLYDGLTAMGFYNFIPAHMREYASPDPSALLAEDGRNIASIVARLAIQSPETKKRIEEYLAVVAPGISQIQREYQGSKETLAFKQNDWNFDAEQMSDGTLRACGALVALFQPAPVTVVGIEEPENALHPAAVRVILGAMREASVARQILITSHSPDLLDDPDVSPEQILGVAFEQGKTFIGPLEPVAAEVLRKRLVTAGDLVRQNRAAPEVPESVIPAS